MKTQLELEGQGRNCILNFCLLMMYSTYSSTKCAATIKNLSTFLTYTIISGFGKVVIYPYSFLNYVIQGLSCGRTSLSSFNKIIRDLFVFFFLLAIKVLNNKN